MMAVQLCLDCFFRILFLLDYLTMSMWWLGVVIPSALAAILVVYLGVLYFLSERVPNLQVC